MSSLVLYLDGPFQGWGYMADHAWRNTLPHPTRSGITGILAAALGIDRNDPEESVKIGRLNTLGMTMVGLQPEGRVVAGRQIRDYHTAQTRNRRGEVVGHADVTRRDYLIDSKFIVMIEGDLGLLDILESAVRNPVWFCTLGRRSCVTTAPILLGRFDSEQAAITELENRLGKSVRVALRVEEVAPDAGGMLLRDLPLSFGRRSFGQRSILVSQS
jgi:CRISPR system Cascade subunit CasD